MAETRDPVSCQQYMVKHIEDLKRQSHRYVLELEEQSRLCPIQAISLNEIDPCLKEFVNCQRTYLRTRNDGQLEKFKDALDENRFLERISAYSPSLNLVSIHASGLLIDVSFNRFHLSSLKNECVHQLITIRQQQAAVWEELLKLEMRVLCRLLPHSFDQLHTFISPIEYSPLMNERKAVQLQNGYYKTIQEAKRQLLHICLTAYEIKLQEYDAKYQEILSRLQSLLVNITNVDGASLSVDIDGFMAYQTTQLKQEISGRMSIFRGRLLRRRHVSATTKNTIGVSPEPYLDLLSNPFTTLEWHHLSLGKLGLSR